MLWLILKRRIGAIVDSEFYQSLGKTLFASLVMWAVILGIGILYPWRTTGPFDERLIYLMFCVIGGAVAFFAAAFLAGSPEIGFMMRTIQRRLAVKTKG
jgi:peptidoglycan biosynthesis protein MviN/MurJ (putative lipid II flippase)